MTSDITLWLLIRQNRIKISQNLDTTGDKIKLYQT